MKNPLTNAITGALIAFFVIVLQKQGITGYALVGSGVVFGFIAGAILGAARVLWKKRAK